MENEFSKLNFTQTAVMIALSKSKLANPVYQFIHDTLIGFKEVPKYFLYNRMIYIVVASSGKSPIEAIRESTREGVIFNDYATQIILAPQFQTNTDVVSVIAIVPGNIFSDRGRTTSAARRKGAENHLHNCTEESALLLRHKLHNYDLKEMNLERIVVMHKALKDESGKKRLLSVYNYEDREGLTARIDNPDNTWSQDTGFAFELLRILPRKI